MAADLPKWLKAGARGLGLGAEGQDAEGVLAEGVPAGALTLDLVPESEPEEAAPLASAAKRGKAKPEDSEPLPAYILRAEADLLKRLRGIRSVTVRVFGEDATDGVALVRHLARHGFDAKLSDIRNFAPAPSTVFTYHYHGPSATVTLAPSFVA